MRVICNITSAYMTQTSTPRQNKIENNRAIRSNTNSDIANGLQLVAESKKLKKCRAHIYFTDNAQTCKQWCKRQIKDKKNIKMLPYSRRPQSVTRKTTEANSVNLFGFTTTKDTDKNKSNNNNIHCRHRCKRLHYAF